MLLDLYRQMKLIRVFEEEASRQYMQGNIRGFLHLYIGEEAIAVGSIAALTPDDYVDFVGADVVRGYLMFIGPWDQGGEWVDKGINGIIRWYNRLWDLINRDESELSSQLLPLNTVKRTNHLLHRTIKKVYQDLDGFHFNTTLATLMEFTNHLSRAWDDRVVDSKTWTEAIKTLLLLLAPTAPHMTEELWNLKGYPYSIHSQVFPKWDEH